jgi:seryl-tRNA synthetase
VTVQAKIAPAADAAQIAALKAKLFVETGVDGVYARTGLYEGVVEALSALISAHRPRGAEVLRFAPVMSRAQIEQHGYLKSFPNLLGAVSCLCGDERHIRGVVGRFMEDGEPWTDALQAADLVLAPAACYPVYPIAAARGPVPEAGYVFDVAADCFRREPSTEIDRFQSFRMREYVRVGTQAQIQVFREAWIERAKGLADVLGLSYRIDLASDPFFGRGGQIVAASQLEQALKFELVVPVHSTEKPTACMSFNYHQDHFGLTWDLKTQGGEPAHTGCVAFGMDRLAVAMFATHGLEVQAWPATVKATLEL